jgi:hypothetical protein
MIKIGLFELVRFRVNCTSSILVLLNLRLLLLLVEMMIWMMCRVEVMMSMFQLVSLMLRRARDDCTARAIMMLLDLLRRVVKVVLSVIGVAITVQHCRQRSVTRLIWRYGLAWRGRHLLLRWLVVRVLLVLVMWVMLRVLKWL